MKIISVLRTGFVVVLLLNVSARADILVSNLSEPFRDASPIGNNPNPVPPPTGNVWYWAAQSFLPDASSYNLGSIDTIVGDGSSSPAPVVVAELHNDNAGLVGSLITTLTAPSVSGAQSIRTFLPDNPVTLSASTPYWFVLGSQAPGDGTYLWSYAEGNNFVGPGALANYNYSEDSGATWTSYGSDNPFYLRVNVSAIPEPSALVTLAMAVSMLFGGALSSCRGARRRGACKANGAKL